MSETGRNYNDNSSHWYTPPPLPDKPRKKRKPRRQAKEILSALRNNGCALELLLERGGFTEKEAKRLDKAVTVMKVAFKIMKKALNEKRAEQVHLSAEASVPQAVTVN